MLSSSTQEHLIAALNDLSTGLAKVANSNSILTANKPLFDSVSESAMSSLKTLTDMFSSATHSAGKLSLTGSHSDSDCQHSRVVSAKDVNSNSILTTNNPSFDSVSESAMSTLKTLPKCPRQILTLPTSCHSAIVIATASIQGGERGRCCYTNSSTDCHDREGATPSSEIASLLSFNHENTPYSVLLPQLYPPPNPLYAANISRTNPTHQSESLNLHDTDVQFMQAPSQAQLIHSLNLDLDGNPTCVQSGEGLMLHCGLKKKQLNSVDCLPCIPY